MGLTNGYNRAAIYCAFVHSHRQLYQLILCQLTVKYTGELQYIVKSDHTYTHIIATFPFLKTIVANQTTMYYKSVSLQITCEG